MVLFIVNNSITENQKEIFRTKQASLHLGMTLLEKGLLRLFAKKTLASIIVLVQQTHWLLSGLIVTCGAEHILYACI